MSKPITSPPVWYIYSLSDPLADGAVRYVGKTINLRKRLREHVQAALVGKEHNHRANWVRQLISRGSSPSLTVLETGEGDWKEAERRWIKNLKAGGANLVNSTDGGEGLNNPSPDTRARISTANTGKRRTPEMRARIGAASKGRRHTRETRTRMSLSRKGQISRMTPETRAKIAENNRRRVISLETRQKMSVASKKRMLGHRHSLETRAKIVAANTGKRHTPETRAKLSAIRKAYYLEKRRTAL